MIGLVTLVAMTSATPTLNDAALIRLAQVVHVVCVNPSTFGYTLGGNIKAGAQGTLPKLYKTLLEAKLSGSIKVSGEIHGGPDQKDVGSIEVQRLRCLQAVFISLFQRFSITDLSTGRPVQAGPSPAATLRRINYSLSTHDGATYTNSGSGQQFNNLTQNGGTIVAHADSITVARDRRNYVSMLQDIYEKGEEIYRNIDEHLMQQEDEEDTKFIDGQSVIDDSDYGDWAEESENRIWDAMGRAATTAFFDEPINDDNADPKVIAACPKTWNDSDAKAAKHRPKPKPPGPAVVIAASPTKLRPIERIIQSDEEDIADGGDTRPRIHCRAVLTYHYILSRLPKELANLKYLMEHDSMDPQAPLPDH
jgi:hypothetical protein